MISFVRFEGHLFHGSKLLFLQILDLVGENLLGREGGVDAVGLDGDHEVASVLHEHGGVEAEDSSLIGLSDIGENSVDHVEEHSVFLGVSSVLNDGHDVGSLFSHVNEVSA